MCKLSHHPLVRSAMLFCTGIIFQCALHSVSPIASSLQFDRYISNSSNLALCPSTGNPPIFKTPILKTSLIFVPKSSPQCSSVESLSFCPTSLVVSSRPVAASATLTSCCQRRCHLRLALTHYPTKPAQAVGRGWDHLHFRPNPASLEGPKAVPQWPGSVNFDWILSCFSAQ